MVFDERDEGDYRIYAGALESRQGDGYTAAVVVKRLRGSTNTPREAFRDESLACGHRWDSAGEALSYALSRAREVIRNRPTMLWC